MIRQELSTLTAHGLPDPFVKGTEESTDELYIDPKTPSLTSFSQMAASDPFVNHPGTTSYGSTSSWLSLPKSFGWREKDRLYPMYASLIHPDMVHSDSSNSLSGLAGQSPSSEARNQTIPHTGNTVSASLSKHVDRNTSVDPKERVGAQIMKLGLESQTLEVNAIYSQSRSNIDPEIGKQAMAFREKVVAALPPGFRAGHASWGATSLYRCIWSGKFEATCLEEYKRQCKQISVIFKFTVHCDIVQGGEQNQKHTMKVEQTPFESSEPYEFRLEVFTIAPNLHTFRRRYRKDVEAVLRQAHLAEGLGGSMFSLAYATVTTAIYLSYLANKDNLNSALDKEGLKYKVVMYICPVEHVIKGDLVAKNPGNSTEMLKEVVVGNPTQGTAEDSIAV